MGDIESDVSKFHEYATKLAGVSSHAADQSDKYAETLQTLQDTSKTFKQVAGHFGEIVVQEQQNHVGEIKTKLVSAEEMADVHNQETPTSENKEETVLDNQDTTPVPQDEDQEETVEDHQDTTTPQNKEGENNSDDREEMEQVKTIAPNEKSKASPLTTPAPWNPKEEQRLEDQYSEEEESELIEKMEQKITFKNESAWKEAKLNLVLSWELDKSGNNTP